MLEMIAKPHSAKKKPWKLFFVGLIYSVVSLMLVTFIFSKDGVLSAYGGILVVMFTVMFSLPLMYYVIRIEQREGIQITSQGKLVREHWKAIRALMLLFLGFVIGFSMWYIVFPQYNHVNFNAQIEIFCSINNPTKSGYDSCLATNGIGITGNVIGIDTMLAIFANNIYVLIFTLIFSLIFGAGSLFILVWNASVIGAAIGMFAKSSLANLPLSIVRYMFHGLPEVLAYFIAALAGGIVSVAIMRKDMEGHMRWNIMQDALTLIMIAVGVLLFSAFLEVFITPIIVGMF